MRITSFPFLLEVFRIFKLHDALEAVSKNSSTLPRGAAAASTAACCFSLRPSAMTGAGRHTTWPSGIFTPLFISSANKVFWGAAGLAAVAKTVKTWKIIAFIVGNLGVQGIYVAGLK